MLTDGKFFPLSFFIVTFLLASCTPSIYSYRIVNDNCNCFTYVFNDREHQILYEFSATYTLHDAMETTITLTVINNGREQLYFDHARVRVSSQNFPYRYNGKFIPFAPLVIPTRRSETVTLVGHAEIPKENEWHLIAGEQLTVTIKGIRWGEKEIPLDEIVFIPANPKLGS